MRQIALVVVVAVMAGCGAVPPETVVAPRSSPSPTVTPSATPAPTAAPTGSPGPLNMTTAVGTIPPYFHYFSAGQGSGFRILLFDEDRASIPAVVLTSGQSPVPPGPDVRSEAFSVSADGRVLVLMRWLSEQRSTYFVLRPETGELRTLYSGAGLGPPVISADGQRIAFPRTSDDPAVNGLWLLAIAGSAAPTRLVSDVPSRGGGPPPPLAWSGDGKGPAVSPGARAGGTAGADGGSPGGGADLQ